MLFNEAGQELILHYSLQDRENETAATVRMAAALASLPREASHRARHPAALWLAERLLQTGESLRAWSAPEPVCHAGTGRSHA